MQDHLSQCRQCRTVLAHEGGHRNRVGKRRIPAAIRRSFGSGTLFSQPPLSVEPGQMWLARDVPGIVVINQVGETPGFYRAHPLSFETAYLSDRDVWLSPCRLACAAMVEAWLEVPIDRVGLSCFLGSISMDIHATVRRLANGRVTTDHAARIGTPLRGYRDPRYNFQLRELAFWGPASERVNRQMTAREADAINRLDPGP